MMSQLFHIRKDQNAGFVVSLQENMHVTTKICGLLNTDVHVETGLRCHIHFQSIKKFTVNTTLYLHQMMQRPAGPRLIIGLSLQPGIRIRRTSRYPGLHPILLV